MDFKTIKGVKRIFITLIALIAVVGVMLVVMPLMSQNQKFAQDIASSQSEESAALEKLNKLKKQKDDIGKVEKMDSDLSAAFPGSANTPGLVGYVSKAAVDAGMSVSNITDLSTGIPTLTASSANAGAVAAAAAPGASAPAAAAPAAGAAGAAPAAGGGSNMAEMTVDISATGSIAQLGQFTTNLTKGERNLLISDFAISSDGATGESTVKISAKTFIYKSIPTVSEASAAKPADSGAAPAPAGATPVATPPAG